MCGCGSVKYAMPYSSEYKVGCFFMDGIDKNIKLETFANDLCIINENKLLGLENVITEPEAAALFSLDDNKVIYAKNVHLQLVPASLIKVLTAIVALKYGNLEDLVIVGDEINNLEQGAQRCGIKEGDVLTMSQLMYVLLIWSANDAAMVIAKHVGGTVENFVEMMNEEALKIGAVNSNFVNPHGLTEENQYVTLYDMYLIFNEALNYETFKDIIQLNSYKSVYKNQNGEDKYFNFLSTNLYLRGDYEPPDCVLVAGGKTGTTFAAGNCLIIYGIDKLNKNYIAIMMNALDKDIMYNQMTALLKEIDN
jgi:D-alanyl-D-alanine carboxypeptidase